MSTTQRTADYVTSRGMDLTRTHRNAQLDLPIVDRVLEPQTIPRFCEFCGLGRLADGKKTTLSLPSPDELMLINHPWNEWAPFSHNNGRETTIGLIMIRIGSYEDGDRLTRVGKNIHALKSRLWEGILPISDTQWRAKELDKPENFDTAAQQLSAVVAVFEYLNSPAVMRNLRETFNLISKHLSEFDAALNAVRAAHGQGPISTSALWQEFMSTRYQVMTTQAHSWVIAHVNALREPIIRELEAHQPTSSGGISHEQLDLSNKIHVLAEITYCSDFGIHMPMHGYIGYNPPAQMEISDLKSHIWDVRRKAHGEKVKIVTHTKILEDIVSNRSSASDTQNPARIASLQAQALEDVRVQARGEPAQLPEEEWIALSLRYMERQTDGESALELGFDVYRLTYDQTDEQWAEFVQKLEAAVGDWGAGISGAEKIKGLLKLHWRDGKELGIAKGDIEAANKHFQANPGKRSCPGWTTLLVIDDASFASFMTDAYTMPTGTKLPLLPSDFGSFILAVEPDYDPVDCDREEEHPGYKGHMRIQPGLIWSELYAMLATSSAYLDDLWPLAMEHPNQVYTGATAPVQVAAWRRLNRGSMRLLKAVVDFVKDTAATSE